MKNSIASFLIAISAMTLCACGSGGSGSGMLIAGTLAQGETAAHQTALRVLHGAGAKIENVQVCALDQCSTTDSLGQWGFVAPSSFEGGEILFSINGHGIAATVVVHIPEGAHEVEIELEHEDGVVSAGHITIDGEDHSEGHAE